MSSTYSIDTSAFIHAWRRDYPPDVFPSVWSKMDELAFLGQIISPEEVLLELERGGDRLYDWAKNNETIFQPFDADMELVVADIVNRWPSFLPDQSHDGIWADPYAIALAKARGAIVVTGEVPVGNNAKRPKIPNVCRDLNIRHTTFLEMLRTEGIHF
ncbi:DUF4411 family protein [Desulfosarcina alkanivorans]|nr:DUF4411 family protein [Desulfosarcina alkanivorans]